MNAPRLLTRRSPRAALATGFSLMELLVAMLIVGVLAAIAVPAYTQYVTRAARAEGRSALERARQEMERWYTANNGYAAFTRDTEAAKAAGVFRFTAHSGDSPTDSAYELSAAACPGATADTCVRITATPGGGRSFRDAECGALWVETRGTRGPTTPASCWR